MEVKRGSNAQLVQNALFKHTSLQTRFSCNMVALVDGTPRTLTLKDFLKHFLDFRYVPNRSCLHKEASHGNPADMI